MNRLAAAVAAKKAAALLPKPAPVAAPEERPLPEMGAAPKRHKDRSKPKKVKEPHIDLSNGGTSAVPSGNPAPKKTRSKDKRPKKEPLSDEMYEAIKNGPHPQGKLQEASRVWFVTPEQFKGLPKAERKRRERPSPDDKGRLPPGSMFINRWDGNIWRGTMILADGEVMTPEATAEFVIMLMMALPPDARTFTGDHSALFRGLAKVDEMYREWKRGQKSEESAPQEQNPLELGEPVG